MYDPIVVQVRDAVEELPEERLEDAERQMRPCRRVMVDDLLQRTRPWASSGLSARRARAALVSQLSRDGGTHEKVVFGIFENEVNTLLFEHDFPQRRHILMRDLAVDLESAGVRRLEDTR